MNCAVQHVMCPGQALAIWPDANIKFAYIEKFVGNAENRTHLLTALSILNIVGDHDMEKYVLSNIPQVRLSPCTGHRPCSTGHAAQAMHEHTALLPVWRDWGAINCTPMGWQMLHVSLGWQMLLAVSQCCMMRRPCSNTRNKAPNLCSDCPMQVEKIFEMCFICDKERIVAPLCAFLTKVYPVPSLLDQGIPCSQPSLSPAFLTKASPSLLDQSIPQPS